MKRSCRGWMSAAVLCLVSTSARGAEGTRLGQAIDFNRDVRPILSENCYTCHGPDAHRRKADLRLDRPESFSQESSSGEKLIVPGDRARSELLARVLRTGRGQMPPRSTGKHLTADEIERLGRWIDQGAKGDEHWAYKSPQRPPLPEVKERAWLRNAIDAFVLQRLEAEKLRPSAEAPRATLIRRLSFDLIGLPPSPAEVDAFVNDPSPNAYEKVVERLLASPHYGERMASLWLDLARYADTNGYRLDNHRDAWKYRDWIIAAFNSNKPFDVFTIEQLAGDMLPGATLEQRIATGFHRNTMVNFGNGSDPREYLFKAVSDRVNTTATVWLGSTLACAQCHDHKYDPFTHRDYYRFYAFFNNVPEKGLDGAKGNPVPSIEAPSAEQREELARLRQRWHNDPRRLQKEEARLRATFPQALVMEEMPTPRSTRVALRGDYQNEGEKVTAGVPTSLLGGSAVRPGNRLELARWLANPSHPLTARVMVNRLWQMHFGTGLVATSDDFGAQGQLPSHPELLDWLACEFVARGWDVKAMHRLIVLSAAYRQSSRVGPEMLERDSDNRLLARGPRIRLDAEMIRDNALSVSGLLDARIGGPSVRPPQPAGLWEQISLGGSYSSQSYVPSKGRDLYRRGVYTYWKRSLPYPSLVAFDAPSRELCTANRARTNTPLQALVLLNDPVYVEAARALAVRVLHEPGMDSDRRLRYAFTLCTGRQPTDQEMTILWRVLGEQQDHYRRDRKAAEKMVSMGETERPADLDVCELAAWTALANALLNLDEVITRG